MCTRFQIKAKDNSVLVCRTMDFMSTIGDDFKEFFSNGAIPFKAKFSHYGIGGISADVICDGLNKNGLSIEALWLPAPYTSYKISSNIKAMQRTIQMPKVILETCKSITDVTRFFEGFTAEVLSSYIEKLLTIHLSVTDHTGKSIVVEFSDVLGKLGQPVIYPNPLGVMTNAPDYQWHRTNLNNWVHITPYNTINREINSINHTTLGFGNNLASLPGDSTPASRYVITNILLDLAYKYEQPKTIQQSKLLADKIAHKISVIRGTSINKGKLHDDVDYTQWIVMKDLANYEYLQKSHNSLNYKTLG